MFHSDVKSSIITVKWLLGCSTNKNQEEKSVILHRGCVFIKICLSHLYFDYSVTQMRTINGVWKKNQMIYKCLVS